MYIGGNLLEVKVEADSDNSIDISECPHDGMPGTSQYVYYFYYSYVSATIRTLTKAWVYGLSMHVSMIVYYKFVNTYLVNSLCECHQIYKLGSGEYRHYLIRFVGQKVKGQGHSENSCGEICTLGGILISLVTRQSESPGHQQRLLQTFTENIFIFTLLVYIAHQSFMDDALYKFTYLLTYSVQQGCGVIDFFVGH